MIDRERFSVIRGGHETHIRPYPISVDYEGINELSSSAEVTKAQQALVEEFALSGLKVLVGLDRIDYTKGIPEKLLAVDRLLEKHPELKERIIFLQMGPISRLPPSSTTLLSALQVALIVVQLQKWLGLPRPCVHINLRPPTTYLTLPFTLFYVVNSKIEKIICFLDLVLFSILSVLCRMRGQFAWYRHPLVNLPNFLVFGEIFW